MFVSCTGWGPNEGWSEREDGVDVCKGVGPSSGVVLSSGSGSGPVR